MSEIEFLSIQGAQSGSISQINATAYTLDLDGVMVIKDPSAYGELFEIILL